MGLLRRRILASTNEDLVAMTTSSALPQPPPSVPAECRPRFWRRQPLLFAVVVVALVVGGFLLGRGLWWSLRPTPDFPSLVDARDPSLRGTVAFLKPFPNECISLVAASGSPEEEVTMTTSDGTRTMLKVGAPNTYTFGGPTWSADGDWFVVKDDLDRLLLVTTAHPSTTRVLVDGGAAPAITDAELLSGS